MGQEYPELIYMDGEDEEKMCTKKPKRQNADLRRTTQRLREGNLDGLAGGAHGATATGTGHDGVVATSTTGGSTAAEQVVVGSGLAGVGGDTVLLLALENAEIHVRGTLGALGGDGATLHVDVAGDVESTELAEGDLPPGLVKTTEVGKLGGAKGRSASSGNVGSKRDNGLLARLETDGDLRLVDVQGHAREAIGLPAEDDGIFVGVVGELSLPVRVLTNPDGAVVRLVVLANRDDAEGLDDALNTLEKVRDDVTDVTDEVAEVVGRGGCGGRSSAGGSSSLRRSSRGLDLLNLDSSSGAGGCSLCGGLLLDGGSDGRSDLSGRGWSGRAEDGAPVDLLPVDIVQVVGNGLPVDIVGRRALSITAVR
jgi:hypothetical protein